MLRYLLRSLQNACFFVEDVWKTPGRRRHLPANSLEDANQLNKLNNIFLFVRQVHVFQAKTREVSTSSKCLPDVFQENMGVFQRLFKPMPCCQQGYGYRLEDMDASCVIRWKTLGAKRRSRFTGLVSACMAYLLRCLRPSLRHAVSMGNNSGIKASTKNPCCQTLGIQLKSGVLLWAHPMVAGAAVGCQAW